MDQHPRHIVAVSGVFPDDDGRILLVKTRDKGWMLPGGQVEPGENLVEAVIRETEEETSCTVEVERLVAGTSFTGFTRPGRIRSSANGACER